MNAAAAIATAGTFVWLGMVLAISFIEAPLKFRAPGVTIRIGVGIGRLVFRALNVCELGLAVGISAALVAADGADSTLIWFAVVTGILLLQLTVVRPRLARRSRAALTGGRRAAPARTLPTSCSKWQRCLRWPGLERGFLLNHALPGSDPPRRR